VTGKPFTQDGKVGASGYAAGQAVADECDLHRDLSITLAKVPNRACHWAVLLNQIDAVSELTLNLRKG
jgi:hypothetical protein